VRAIDQGQEKELLGLGCGESADVNFKINKEGAFPLLVAVAKGKYCLSPLSELMASSVDIIKVLLQNKKLDLNQTDSLGVNAFWLSCYQGNIQVKIKFKSQSGHQTPFAAKGKLAS